SCPESPSHQPSPHTSLRGRGGGVRPFGQVLAGKTRVAAGLRIGQRQGGSDSMNLVDRALDLAEQPKGQLVQGYLDAIQIPRLPQLAVLEIEGKAQPLEHLAQRVRVVNSYL